MFNVLVKIHVSGAFAQYVLMIGILVFAAAAIYNLADAFVSKVILAKLSEPERKDNPLTRSVHVLGIVLVLMGFVIFFSEFTNHSNWLSEIINRLF